MYKDPLRTKSKYTQQLTIDTMIMKASIYTVSFTYAKGRNLSRAGFERPGYKNSDFAGVPTFDASVWRKADIMLKILCACCPALSPTTSSQFTLEVCCIYPHVQT